MTPEAIALIAAYFTCSEAAELRVLERTEAEACAAAYMEIKVGFVPNVDMQAYQSMTPEERADVNRRGYAGYVAWRAANPDLVSQMEAEARQRLLQADG